MKRQSSRFPGLTTICTVAGMLRAQVIKTKLESAGIPALLDYESLGPVIGVTVDGLGEVRILVSTKDAEDARALIEES
jgi:hypothetical protein